MVETRNLTVMFTDIKGFTKKTALKKREDIERFLDLHEKLVTPIFKEFKGRVVKTIGDAFMVVFESPTNAVLCGMKIQDTLRKYNVDPRNDEKFEVRIAVNSGEVHIRGDDVFGEAVNIASRIEGIAEANDIFFTESVYLSMNKNEIPSAEIGYRKLKGIPEEIKVYKVLRESKSAEKRARLVEDEKPGFFGRIKSFWRRRKKWIIIAFILLFLIGVITSPKNIIKKEENIDKFIQNAENAINSGNYEEAKRLVNKLEQLPDDQIPPKLALEGAKLYTFLRQPKGAIKMIQIAKNNSPTKQEMQEINSFVKSVTENLSPEEKQKLTELANK